MAHFDGEQEGSAEGQQPGLIEICDRVGRKKRNNHLRYWSQKRTAGTRYAGCQVSEIGMLHRNRATGFLTRARTLATTNAFESGLLWERTRLKLRRPQYRVRFPPALLSVTVDYFRS